MPGAETLDLEVFGVVQGYLPVAGEVVAALDRAVVEWARLGVAGLELLAGGGVGERGDFGPGGFEECLEELTGVEADGLGAGGAGGQE